MSDIRALENAANSRSRLPWILGIVVVLLVAGGIFFITSAGSDADSAASAEPVRGGTLEFALIDHQRSPDPHWGTNYAESLVANNVTDKLLWQDPKTGEITPWLAETWEHNDELTEFTFHLRDDVTFSDGEPLDAEAVKANFDQYILGDSSLGIIANGAVLFPGYVGTDVVDEHTVTLRFERPLASALQALSFTANAGPGLLSPNTLKLNAEQRSDPTKIIGTGPFVYESWEEQVRTVLVKREGYDWSPPKINHQGEAYLDKIVFNTIPEASVRTGSLSSGTIDATLDVGTTDEEPLAAQGFKIISRGVSGTAILFNFNTSLFPTNDIAVRRAIQLGWNRDAVEKTVLTDSYSVAGSVLEKSVTGFVDYSDSVLKYDPDQAKKVLEDAGWTEGADGVREKDGKKLVVKLLGANNLVANKPSFESIQQDLKAIGIDLQLTVVPIPDLAAETPRVLTHWNIQTGNRSRNDPAVLNLQYNPEITNAAYLTDASIDIDIAEFTETVGKLESTLDPVKRAEYAKQAQDLIVEKYALTNPVYNPAQVIAHAPYIHGILFDAQSRNHFVDTYKDKAE